MDAEYFVERHNPDFGYFYRVSRHLDAARTAYQDLQIVDTPSFGKVLLLDRITQVGVEGEYLYHEPMVHPALTCHPDPKRVLVIGAGDGGIIREVLKHPVEEVVHAELDGEVIDFCKQYLPEISRGAFDDPRYRAQIGDGRAFVMETDERFDVVIMDMTDPFGPSRMLYTREFFAAVKQLLRDERGLFTMHAESPIARPQTYQQIHRTLGEVFRHQRTLYLYIHMYAMYWSVVVNSDSTDIATVDEQTLTATQLERGIADLRCYTPQTHHAMQVRFPFVQDLHDRLDAVPVITDAAPTFLDDIEVQAEPLRISGSAR